MKVQSFFHSGIFKNLLLGISVLFLLSAFVFPVCAAENTGLVEVHLSVPEDFSENVVVTVVNLENYDEYATRLMKTNGYVSFFELPVGKYSIDGAFLENCDFRYNTNLTSGNETFTVLNGSDKTSALLTFETVLNEDIGTVVKPTDPPDPTETVSTEPISTEPSSAGQTVVPTGSNTNQSATESTTAPSEETSSPEEATTVPSTSLNPTEKEDDTAVPGASTSEKDETSSSKSDKKDNKDSDLSKDTESDEKQGISVKQKIFYAAIATTVFVLLVFACAFLYRRHLENS